MNDKTATVATRGVSRAFEGLVGAALGGTAGGVLGALAYEPTKPREWVDEQGNIYDRPLTDEEQKTRLAVATASALAGALGGAGVSLGGAKLLRDRVTAVEREGAQQVANEFLQPLRHLLDDWTSARIAQQVSKPGWARSQTGKTLDKRIEAARVLLQKQEKKIGDLVDTAAERRAGVPFVGGIIGDQPSMSHLGAVKAYTTGFAKRYGHPEMNLDNAYRVFTDAVSSKMTKVSAAAFRSELEKIARTFSMVTGREGVRLALKAPKLKSTTGASYFSAPRAMGLDASGKATGAQQSTGAKLRNTAAPTEQLPPVKVSAPPTPDPTPGS